MVTMYPIDAAMLCFDSFQSPVNALLTGDVEQQQLHSSLNSRSKIQELRQELEDAFRTIPSNQYDEIIVDFTSMVKLLDERLHFPFREAYDRDNRVLHLV